MLIHEFLSLALLPPMQTRTQLPKALDRLHTRQIPFKYDILRDFCFG